MADKSHWMQPLKGQFSETRHLILWCETERLPLNKRGGQLSVSLKRLVPTILCASDEGTAVARAMDPVIDYPGALECLRALEPHPRHFVWFPRGWQDLVMSGMADAIDKALYRWRHISIDGQRLSARGMFEGRRYDLAGLANWTGGVWDNWRAKLTKPGVHHLFDGWRLKQIPWLLDASEDEVLAIATLESIVECCRSFSLGTVKGSSAAQARSWWKIWGGPRVYCSGELIGGKPQIDTGNPKCYVAPLPSRPPHAAAAERHAAYGMLREQYCVGRVDGPIYVIDMRGAYLAALRSTAIPVKFLGRISARGPEALAREVDNAVGLALVLISETMRPYPIRRRYRTSRALGNYWTWLAGRDLQDAVKSGSVTGVHAGWKWSGSVINMKDGADQCSLAQRAEEDGMARIVPPWRAVYSSCVGGFAQWARTWVDANRGSQFGSWATWIHYDPRTYELTRYRSVAGRVQYRADMGDDSRAVPLVYACVLAEL